MSEPPLPSTRRKLLLAKYGPLTTIPFYLGFSSHILVPDQFTKLFSSEFGPTTASTFCLASHVGVGAFLFWSKHLRNAKIFKRFSYSVFGSTVFNFGNILLMSVVRSIFPSNVPFRLTVGLSAAGILLLVGKTYVDHVDEAFDGIRFRAATY